MRSLRNIAVLMCLCLILFAPGAFAMDGPSRPARREVDAVTRFVRNLQAFLRPVWENEGAEIDPWGGKSQGNGGPVQEDPATPSADEGFQIDPWG